MTVAGNEPSRKPSSGLPTRDFPSFWLLKWLIRRLAILMQSPCTHAGCGAARRASASRSRQRKRLGYGAAAGNQTVTASPLSPNARMTLRTVSSSQPTSRAMRGSTFASRTGQEYLAATQDKGVFGAQARFQRLALLIGYGTYKDWFHVPYYTTIPLFLSEHALGRGRSRGAVV